MAVVGAGLLGSATARALAARGVPALLFEQFALGHARGSSHGATRIFRYSYPDPCYVEMVVRAGEAWARLTADAGEDLLVRTGGLDAGPGAEDCAKALASLPAQQAPARKSRRHLTPLIPAGHGIAAVATFVLAVVSAISAR